MIDMKSILEKNNISYQLIKHEKPIRTAKEGAEFFGCELGQTAPTLIIKTERGFFALIVSARQGGIDFAEVAAVLGCQDVQLASKEEVKKLTGCSVGSVPLVGHNLPCVIDKRLLGYSAIYGGSGQATCTLKLDPARLFEVNRVVATIH
ncbi:aminoacyl-tRNA deacylase [Brevibacillus massiliensis]|jgi:prolyl-tRNA editing enzyme YbaK/EbsC (Cys-tRNA(Pro) deacylase)|uniref:aminoacyl-tRNA deacylase n=1 Tax=Brevibacillus massiliensis TaxID=1118054 RepID=UPI000314DD7C|nr:YbaK/EbsC family protein [Brevibacillus massiliensis]